MRRGFSTAQLTTIYATVQVEQKEGKSSLKKLGFLHLQCNTPLFSVNVVGNKQVPMLKLKCRFKVTLQICDTLDLFQFSDL